MINEIILRDAVRGQWLRFQHPSAILTTSDCGEVVRVLAEVETAVRAKGVFAVGFISYEAAPAFDTAFEVVKGHSFPLVWFGLYSQPSIISLPQKSPRETQLLWKANINQTAYGQAFRKIKNHIAEGDCYQANYSFRLTSKAPESPFSLFTDLIAAQKAPYGAYIETDDWAILSASHELFFQLNGNTIHSRPMKGTAPRELTSEDDRQQSETLRQSEKNRAENVMIVDMVRHDLGKIAVTGSVRVPSLYSIEKYPTLWQMTSTVSAETKAGWAAIMGALFPPASVTGAPKARVTQIIAQTETSPRNIYTGTIGFLAPNREAQFNVAIRTVLVNKKTKKADYGIGSGLVWDSDEKTEYDECRTKAEILTRRVPDFSLLETILWTPEDSFFLLDRHLARLKESSDYFGFEANPETVRDGLYAAATHFKHVPTKVRVLIKEDGEMAIEAQVLPEAALHKQLVVEVARQPVNSANPFLYHKTTHRAVYASHQTNSSNVDDVLLWNERGEITEFRAANVAVEMDGQLITPPVRCGLLAGTFRAHLLENKKIKEGVLKLDDLKKAGGIFSLNSIRKMKRVHLRIASKTTPPPVKK